MKVPKEIAEAANLASGMDRESAQGKVLAVGYRTLSIGLSVIFFAMYSKGIFILFMGSEGFFSYDLLTTGTVGLEVFFFTTELILLFFAVSTLGALIPVLKYLLRREFKLADLGMFAGFLVVNVLVWLGLGPAMARASDNDIKIWIVLFALSLLICFHLAMLFYRPPKDGLRSLVAVLVTLMALTTITHKEMVSLLQFGLKHFGVGGEIPITMKIGRPGNVESLTGRLIFLSPDHAYVLLKGETELSIIPRSAVEIIKVSSKTTSSK